MPAKWAVHRVVGSDRRPVHGIREYRLEPSSDARRITSERVLEPVKRLDNAHRWPSCPEEFAGRGRLEADGEISKRERFKPCINMDDDMRRNHVRQFNVVSGGNAINNHPRGITPRKSINDGPRIRVGRLVRQAVKVRLVIKAAHDLSKRPVRAIPWSA